MERMCFYVIAFSSCDAWHQTRKEPKGAVPNFNYAHIGAHTNGRGNHKKRDSHQSVWILGENAMETSINLLQSSEAVAPPVFVERVSRSPVVWPASTSNQSNTGKMPKTSTEVSMSAITTNVKASVYHPAAHLLRNLRPTGRARRDESISHPMVQSLSLSHWYFHLFRPFQGTGFVISSPLGMLSTRGTTAWNVTASFQWTFRLSCRKATVVFDALLCMSFAMESRPIMTVRTWSTWSLVAQLSCSSHPHAIGSWTANWAPSGSWAWK
jgi:hypothetical protein